MKILTRAAALAVVTLALLVRPAAAAPPVVGQQYRWALTFRASLEGNAGAPPGVAALEGEWRSLVVAVRPDSYDVRLQLSVLKIDGTRGGAVTAKERELAQTRLSQPFWITCSRAGALQSVHFLAGVSASDRNLLQTLATETQFVQPASAAEWKTTERDGGGTYFALYQQRDGTHVTKKKLEYVVTGSESAASQALALTIDASDVSFALTEDGAIASVDSVEAVRLSIPGVSGNSLITRFETHLSGMRASMETVTAAALPPAHGVDDMPVATHQGAAASRRDTDAQILAGRSTAAILAGASSGDPVAERQLAPMFRTRPESISLGVARLSSDAGTQLIAGAMAEAGTEPVIRALATVARDTSRPTAVRMHVVMAIEGIRTPSLTAMRIPVLLLDDPDAQVRNAARLAAGALARAGRDSHAAEADAIDTELLARLDHASTVSERTAFMGALGNSAGPRVLPVLTAALADGRDDVRAAAAHALRLVPGAPIDRLLATAATDDPSAVTRAAALFAISFRRPLSATLWDAVVTAARHDSAAIVRNRAVSLLREDKSRPGDAAETLAWIAKNDPEDALRRLAGESLAGMRTGRAPR